MYATVHVLLLEQNDQSNSYTIYKQLRFILPGSGSARL